MRRFVGGFRPTYGSFADRVNIVDMSDATLDPVLAKVSLWSMLSKKGLRSRANGDSCLEGGRRVGDDGAAGSRSGAALL
jgi:hypothetical protein